MRSHKIAHRFAAVGIMALVVSNAPIVLAADIVHLLETGSSLLYPLFNLWVPDYTRMHPNVRITTQSTGSGTGISQAISGVAQIGASDAYLSDSLTKMHPDILNIPLAISSQTVNYNIPGLNAVHLKFSGPVLAAIYQDKITKWNDPVIAKMNPGVKLPPNTIIPIHRADGSGDTFIFTQYLTETTPEWAKNISYGTSINWPSVPGGLGALGNQGMVTTLQRTQYSIAYVGISFKAAIVHDRLGEGMLENRAGGFMLASDRTVQAAANNMVSKTPPDGRISLILAPGADSYPIINYEYAIVRAAQPSPVTAQAVREFLHWAVQSDGGNAQSFMQPIGFVPLPDTIRKLSEGLIARIQSH